jgi:hypothetical protein
MHHLQLVEVLDPRNQFLEEFTSFHLFELGVLDDVVKQFPSADVLHHQEYMLRGLDNLRILNLRYLIELNDMWMAYQFQNMYLSLDSFHVRHLHDSVLLEDLDGHLLSRLLVGSHFYLAEGALSQSFALRCTINAVPTR